MSEKSKQAFPWVIAILASLVLMVSNGMSISGLSVFDESLLNEFGWNRGELKFRDMITLGVTGLAAPFLGVLLDRYGVRACMIVGWVLLGGAYYLYSSINSLGDMYLVHVILGFVLVLCGLNAGVILVSNWFVEKRGTAIGIALVGTSLGGAIFPQYGTAMIEAVGWRDAYMSEMVFPVVLLLLTIFVIRSKPSDKGMVAYGASADATTSPADEGMEYGAALKTVSFWALATIACTTFYSVLGVQAHIFLHMRDMEFDVATATNAISIFFLCALVGKFVFGLVADSIGPKKVFYVNIAVMLIGAVALASMKPAMLWGAVVLFGLGWGGVYTVLQLSAIECFGLKSAGKILGTITVLDAIGGGLGIWLTGVMYASAQSYQLPFTIFCGLILVALLAITQVRYPDKG
ncbi:MFS transporter [Halioglobus maricola]|uniref:MFS transporter n=1 Tax=Halioglobus maricola TaxID=2601894 RepID=A0A5P9NJY0_9GAMM|nr:MFS transporter [Halioglobus maricola]QFU75544.1 MFS transporter [Halioglobus maricola]